jgi:hypothetical protein
VSSLFIIGIVQLFARFSFREFILRCLPSLLHHTDWRRFWPPALGVGWGGGWAIFQWVLFCPEHSYIPEPSLPLFFLRSCRNQLEIRFSSVLQTRLSTTIWIGISPKKKLSYIYFPEIHLRKTPVVVRNLGIENSYKYYNKYISFKPDKMKTFYEDNYLKSEAGIHANG